ncbi:MAG: riboflavin synthase [Gammaproteobacteria bacterium]
MFTGIVRGIGEVVAIGPVAHGSRLVVGVSASALRFARGSSVSINGSCLTVAQKRSDRYAFDLSEETLRCTTLGNLAVGDGVNLEPALRLRDELGGHFVSGHIDGVGVIIRMETRGDCMELEIESPESLMRLMAVKGSIAVDGVSLTVNTVDAGSLSVMLIPFTRAQTIAGHYVLGQRVNLEVDLLARYLDRLRGSDATPVDVDA